MLGQIQRTVISGAATLLLAGLLTGLLTGCSFYKEGRQSPEKSHSSRGWNYQKAWEATELPENLTVLTDGKVTIKGQCHFSGSLLSHKLGQKRTIMMPFLTSANDGSLAPVFKKSLPVYKALKQYLHLAPAPESVQLYQRWVSSLEHACPEGLSREISQCSLKNIYSLGGLWGSDSLYNFDRLNHWLTQNSDNAFLLIPNFSLLSSKAASGLKYSSNTLPVVKQPVAERIAVVTPYLGRQSLDWVILNSQQQLDPELASSGRCSVVWQELEQFRIKSPLGKLSIEQLNQVDQALIPVLLSFMNDSLNQLNALKH